MSPVSRVLLALFLVLAVLSHTHNTRSSGAIAAYAVDPDLKEDNPEIAGFGDGDEDDDEGLMDDEDEDEADADSADPPKEADKPAVIDPPGKEGKGAYAAPNPGPAAFHDDFQSGMDKWQYSQVGRYNGRFKIGQGASPVFEGDRGLVIPEKARHYGLSTLVSGLQDLSSKDFALSYEVKLDDGMTCGGAYLKLPTKGFTDPKKFDNDVKYSVMFGPDKCGSTDKVHFIFQSLNPVTNEFAEHHMKNPPSVATSYDKKHHLYTLNVFQNGSFSVAVDNVVKREGLLAEEFDPPVQPEKEIDDPDDKKPKDWVDEAKISDPDATKPDDWDEDAPKEIPDEDAEKPKDWLDDEPLKIPDPEAKKPETWDDEEDGDWEAPEVDNPKCKESGCGEWKRPMKPNPDYKGKWKAPLIDNPKYVGEWKPRKISNPKYYQVESISLLPVHGVGFEIWTMDQGVLFDDIWLGTDISASKEYIEASFGAKKAEGDRLDKIKKEKEAKESKKSKPMEAAKRTLDTLEKYVDMLEDKLSFVEDLLVKIGAQGVVDQLIDLGVTKPMVVVVVVPSLLVLLFCVILSGGGKKRRVPPAASYDAKKNEAPSKEDTKAEVVKATGTDISETTEDDTDRTVRKRRAAKVE